MGGALNPRPGKIDSALPSLGLALESPVSETLSEREHRQHTESLHDAPRLLDRPPPLQYGSSFHGGRGERVNPADGPIVTSRSSASGSDHTIDALRTPPSMYPSERVVRVESSSIYVPDLEHRSHHSHVTTLGVMYQVRDHPPIYTAVTRTRSCTMFATVPFPRG